MSIRMTLASRRGDVGQGVGFGFFLSLKLSGELLMAVTLLETQVEDDSVTDPFLMENSVDNDGNEHGYIINISRDYVAATSVSNGFHDNSDEMQSEDRPSTSNQVPASPTSTYTSRNVSLRRRHDNNVRRHRSPLNSGLWISIELIVNVSQIIAAIIVLSLSRHEHPRAPLFAWVIGYTVGCAATLPHLYWRYSYRNSQGSDQASIHAHQTSFQNNSSAQTTERRGSRGPLAVSRLAQNFIGARFRLNTMVEHFKMALDCFFAVWFVVGNVWIFGGHSAGDAPNLYRLCIAFLTLSCIGYAMPFILCATICCCFPCIISILGFREDLANTRGATSDSINALPTYKFTSKRHLNQESSQLNLEAYDGGILAAGTDSERLIFPEDAVCCICLARYMDNDELRALPCNHFFHTHCVDKWLKINALCPLCKYVVGHATGLSSILRSIHRNSNQMVRGRSDAAENVV